MQLRRRRAGSEPSAGDTIAGNTAPAPSKAAATASQPPKPLETTAETSDEAVDVDPDRNRSTIARLWLQSRCLCPEECDKAVNSLTPQSNLRGKGEDRPVTLTNLRLAWKLLLITWWGLLDIFWVDKKVAICGWLAGRLIAGSLPACK